MRLQAFVNASNRASCFFSTSPVVASISGLASYTSSFKTVSDVLNRVQIGTVWRPRHDLYTLLFEPGDDLLNSMDRGVVLHESEAWFVDPKEVIVEHLYIGVGGISVFFTLEIPLQSIEV